MSFLCENQTDWVTKDYYDLYVFTLNYILGVQNLTTNWKKANWSIIR